jgi:hypothetical protein
MNGSAWGTVGGFCDDHGQPAEEIQGQDLVANRLGRGGDKKCLFHIDPGERGPLGVPSDEAREQVQDLVGQRRGLVQRLKRLLDTPP